MTFSTSNLRVGFTLVELIVVVTITMIISAGLLVNYTTHNDTQRVRQAALTLKNNLRLAQTKAMSGAKPRDVSCTILRGYITTFQSTTYDTQALCTEGAVGEKLSYTLPASVRFTVSSPVTFSVLSGSVSTSTTLTVRGVSKTYSVDISASGEMTLSEGE